MKKKMESEPIKMHLQWFGGTDEGDGEVGESEGGKKSGLFNPHNVLDDDDFEVVTTSTGVAPGSDPYAEKSKEDLIRELKEREAREEMLKSQADTNAALLAGLRDLKPVVNPQYPPQPQQAPAPAEKPLTKEELTQLFIDDPEAATSRIVMDRLKMLEPALQKTLNSSKETSRRFAYSDPDSKSMLDRYGPEIEAQVNSIPIAEQLGNVNLYQDAIQVVKARHINDIASDAVANAIKEKDAEIAKLRSELARGGGSRASFNENFTRPVSQRRQIYMTKAEEDKMRREAAILGMDFKDYMRSKEIERSE